MRRTALALVVIVSMSGFAAAQEFAEYVNVGDGFKIDFPGQPATRDITWTSQQDYTLPGHVYSVDKGAEHYSVTVIDFNGIEKMGIARSEKCVSGDRPLCKGTDVAGPGVWKHDLREAVMFATMKFVQRPNVKVSDLTWAQHDLVEGNELQLTNTADGSRTYAYIALHEMKLFIVEATVPRTAPPATLFQTSMGWVDKNGKGIRYRDIYSGALHSLRVYPVPPVTGGNAANAAAQ